jgi:ribose transport system permease protein
MSLSRSRMMLYTQVVILLLLVAVATMVSPYFLTSRNITNILRQASLIVIPAVGQAVVIISGGFDLSVGAILTLSAVMTGLLFKAGVPIYLAAMVGILAGVLAGCVNGLMVSRVKLPPFVATYGMMFALQGTAMMLLHGDYIVGLPESFQDLARGAIGIGEFRVPYPFLAAILAALTIGTIMTRTTLGRRIHALGANSEAARLSGVNTPNIQLLAFVLCGFVAAIGGLVVMARMNGVEMRMGDDFLLPTVAAVILGGCSLAGGEGSVWGTFVGAIVLTVVTNVMTLAGAPDYWRPAVSGVVIIAAVVIDLFGQRALLHRLGRQRTQPVAEPTASGSAM